jgi:hypothetical protein
MPSDCALAVGLQLVAIRQITVTMTVTVTVTVTASHAFLTFSCSP